MSEKTPKSNDEYGPLDSETELDRRISAAEEWAKSSGYRPGMEYEEVDHNGLHKHGDYLNLDPAEIEHLRLLASGDLYKAPEWVDSPALADDWKYDPDEGLDDDEPTPDYETGYWEVTPDTGIPGPLPPGLDAPSPDA